MATRLDLQTSFENLLGSRNVYFQSPESTRMSYPAIRYSRKNIENVYANSSVYNQHNCYEVVVIYRDPDSDLPHKIASMPMCRFDRHYTAENLNHDVFTLYF